MQQLTLGEVARDVAIEKVESGAELWCARVVDLIRAMPRGHEFSTDQLWGSADALGLATHEPRAMGAAVKNARVFGLVESTGRYVKSERPACHARPVLVWRRR